MKEQLKKLPVYTAQGVDGMKEDSIALLKKIQELDKSKVFSLIYPAGISIEQSDVDDAYDCIKTLGSTDRIDFILYSYGGDADAAYKLITVIREFCKELLVIIPSEAKSAATLMALGADRILMGPLSELGPIDPVVSHPMLPVMVPARAILKFIEEHLTVLSEIPRAKELPLVPVDPVHMGYCRLAIDSAKEYAEILLRKYNLKGQSASKVKTVVGKLVGGGPEAYASHSFVIDFAEAQNLGLNVERMSEQLCALVWELYTGYKADLRKLQAEKKVQVIVETENGRSNIIKEEPKRLYF